MKNHHLKKKPVPIIKIITSRYFWSGLVFLLFFAIGVSISYTSKSLQELELGIEKLDQGKSLLLTNPAQARTLIQESRTHLSNASNILLNAPLYTKIVTPLPPFSTQVQLIKSSYNLARSGEIALELLEKYPNLEDHQQDISSTIANNVQYFLVWHQQNQAQISELRNRLEMAQSGLRTLPLWLVKQNQTKLKSVESLIQTTLRNLNLAEELIQKIQFSLGANDSNPHTWLIVLQNDAELRPTGGFIGSFATLTGSGGTLRQFKFGSNVYKLDKALSVTNPIKPPDPLTTITPTWGFRDSNFGSGFLAEIAPNLQNIFTQETGTPPEGIIFLDGMLIRSLLQLTGPITPSGSNVSINYDNFVTELAQQIELEYFKLPANKITNEPKAILNDLIPPLIEKLLQIKDPVQTILPVLDKSIGRKDIQFWSQSQDLETLFTTMMPADQPLKNSHWLKILNSNIGGAKSSINVWQDAYLTKGESLDNFTEYTLKITRSHKGNGRFPDSDNLNYLEIYLPFETKILELPQSIGGSSILPQKTQVDLGIWQKTWATTTDERPPSNLSAGWKRVRLFASTVVGQSTNYTLKYQVPATWDRLMIIKQAGSSHETIHYQSQTIELEKNLEISL